MRSHCLIVLLAATFLAHTVLGCCWHHGHPGDVCASGAGSAERHAGCEAHSHVHRATSDAHAPQVEGSHEEPNPGHEHRHLCHEPDCMYVAGKAVALEDTSPTTWCKADLVTAPCDGLYLAQLTTATDFDREQGAPAELRAALQVWQV